MTRTTLTRATTSLALLTLWIIPATQLVPSLVIAAYEQRSLPLLNALIVNRVDHPVEEYLEYWRNVTWLGAIWCVAIWALPSLVRYLSSPGFFDRAVRPATPGALGLIRSWVCGIALVMNAVGGPGQHDPAASCNGSAQRSAARPPWRLWI